MRQSAAPLAEKRARHRCRCPALRVFVGAGYYDLATPFFSAEYAVNHMGLDPKLRDQVSISYYEAGHMMYTQLKSLEKARQDLGKFVTSCLP